MRSGIGSGSARAGIGSGGSASIQSPSETSWLAATDRPFQRTRPSSIQRRTCERDSPTRAASTVSRRWPSSLSPTRKRGNGPALPAGEQAALRAALALFVALQVARPAALRGAPVEAEPSRLTHHEPPYVDGGRQPLETLVLDEGEVGRVHLGDLRDVVEIDALPQPRAPQPRARPLAFGVF